MQAIGTANSESSIYHGGNVGVYMANKISKLQSSHSASADSESDTFKHCAIFVNGYTDPPVQELRRLVVTHGGNFNSYLTGSTTHFVCNHFTDAQLKAFRHRTKPTKLVYVTVSWILESISELRALPVVKYLPSSMSANKAQCMELFAVSDQLSSVSTKVQLPTNPRKMTNSEDNPDFLKQYFANSRLHFIGIWRNRLPKLSAQIRLRNNVQSISLSHANPQLLSSTSLTSSSSCGGARVVIHVDMDCFFVSALVRNDSRLRSGSAPQLSHRQTGNSASASNVRADTGAEVPVGVAHCSSDQGAVHSTAEISSCNYAARARGLKNGMFLQKAKQLCPELEVLRYDFPLYHELSQRIYEVLFALPAVVEPVSVDEAYVEFPAGTNGLEQAFEIRRRLFEATGGCSASAGVGSNMLLARLATKQAKPNGQHEIAPDPAAVTAHMTGLPVQQLPGVGYALLEKLQEQLIVTCGQLWPHSLATLKSWCGDAGGQLLYEASRGVCVKQLEAVAPRQSIGAEVSWGLRFTVQHKSEEFLAKLADEVSERLVEAGRKGGTVTVKLKKRQEGAGEAWKVNGCGRCDNLSRSVTLRSAVYKGGDIAAAALPVYRALIHDLPVTELRGMGITVSKLKDMDTVSALNADSLPGASTRAGALQPQPQQHSPGKRSSDAQGEDRRGLCDGSSDEENWTDDAPGDMDMVACTILSNRQSSRHTTKTSLSPASLPAVSAKSHISAPAVVTKMSSSSSLSSLSNPHVTSKRSRFSVCDYERTRQGVDAVCERAGQLVLPSHSQLDYSVVMQLPAPLRDAILTEFSTASSTLSSYSSSSSSSSLSSSETARISEFEQGKYQTLIDMTKSPEAEVVAEVVVQCDNKIDSDYLSNSESTHSSANGMHSVEMWAESAENNDMAATLTVTVTMRDQQAAAVLMRDCQQQNCLASMACALSAWLWLCCSGVITTPLLAAHHHSHHNNLHAHQRNHHRSAHCRPVPIWAGAQLQCVLSSLARSFEYDRLVLVIQTISRELCALEQFYREEMSDEILKSWTAFFFEAKNYCDSITNSSLVFRSKLMFPMLGWVSDKQGNIG